MAAQIDGVFESGLQQKIKESKVLVVGAGGIGCEILKNLVLTGFQDIEIIDLDTIDVSNLNRQFLFHKEHVGKSKANVARESALTFNPNANIKAYHDSITTNNYGVNFFQRFSIVLNALDNRAARSHVNRLCLTADVPLIESGTAGYNGQVELIKRGLTTCYECFPQPAQKTFPGCTIRNTPSEPIHCIVWAKHLFNQLFGESAEDEDVSPDTADPEAGAEVGQAALEKDANEKGNVDRVNTRTWAKECQYDAEKIFNKLFYDDIKYLLTMSNLWKNRNPPKPAKWDTVQEDAKEEDAIVDSVARDQTVLSMAQSAKLFAESIKALEAALAKLPDGDHLVWDKDDKEAMDFVAACANIRAQIFNIPRKSRFEIKSMAGNIIPAIATTNAITAGIVVMRAFRVLQQEFEKCKTVYVRLRVNPRNQFIVPDTTIIPPNPKCYVCAAKPEVVLKLDTKKLTVRELRDDILIKALNMISPDVMLDGANSIVISSEEGETDCNNAKTLEEMKIVDGCILKVDDFLQNYELSITVLHKDPGREEAPFEIVADAESLKPKEAEAESSAAAPGPSSAPADDAPQPSTSKGVNGSANGKNTAPNHDSDDDLCIVEEEEENVEGRPSTSKASSSKATVEKRKHAPEEDEPANKKAKVSSSHTPMDEDDDLIILD
ncbi:SUMO-activating enzyme subunit 2 [Anopheles stephensi]|uniref:SUMO-activating enzyme subunit 2 n=1 Tax=Anopheles stephensi TaxID=30069 RepID=UPI0016589230|nr:SUMO-activating enzyme subunit 2 [Anopheles stephensi]XP_035912803.1 SUMO-activating enzyme subunit 2 [Anopheles stephensi]